MLKKPLVTTSEEVMDVGKESWKGINLEANIESDYIYSTILGKDLIPFGYVKFRPIVLPCEPSGHGFRLLDIESLRG
jgi:hypothetical protein